MKNNLPERKHLKRIVVFLPESKRVIYFVTVCSYKRRKIFITDKPIQVTLESLIKSAESTGWNILNICFMPDHVHLLLSPLQTREQKLSKIIQRWKSSSKQRLNSAGIKGSIWQAEFFDHLLRSDESLTDKWNYVEMNPVRAGLSISPEKYPYIGTPTEILNRL